MLNKPTYISPREAKAEREAAHAQSIDAQIEMEFQVGERVRVRDSPDKPFLQGVVQKIRHDGRPFVCRDTEATRRAFPFYEVERIPSSDGG